MYHLSSTWNRVEGRRCYVKFSDLEEKDLYNLTKSMEYIAIPWDSLRIGKPLWYVMLMEITGNKEEIIYDIEETYAPQNYMLNEYIKKNININALESIRIAAKKLQRSDVELCVSDLQKITVPEEPIGIHDINRISTLIEATSTSKWADWKDFAGLLGYNATEIETIKHLVSPSRKAIQYIKDHRPDTSIALIKNLSISSINIHRCCKLRQCIRDINKRLFEQ